MPKSSKKSASKVDSTPAVVAQPTKSMKKGKRDAEEIIEKKVVSSKKQKIVNGGVAQAVEKKKVETKTQKKNVKKQESSSSEESSSESEEEQKKVVAPPKKAAAPVVKKPVKESSSSDESDSSSDEEPKPSKKQSVKSGSTAKPVSSSDESESSDDSDSSDAKPSNKKSGPTANNGLIGKPVSKDSSDVSESSDDSDSSDEETPKKPAAVAKNGAVVKNGSAAAPAKKADSSDDSSSEESDSDEEVKVAPTKKPAAVAVTKFKNEEGDSGNEDSDNSEDDEDEDEDNENESDDEGDGKDKKIGGNDNHADMEELEKEYNNLRHEEQDLFRNIRCDQNEDLMKGEAVKNQRALWDKTLEFRFLLQKSFSSSNRLPQEPIRSAFCNYGEGVKEAYSDLIDSTKKTLDFILKLQEALVEKNPSILEATEGDAAQYSTGIGALGKSTEGDEEWFQISQMQSRIGPFREMSVDKWQRKTQVTSGAAGMKNKFQAFNQNISEQVASYMRDPSRMIKGMQQRRSVVPVFGNVSDSTLDKDEVINADGDPELLDDSEFYQQLLREFFETVDAGSSETAFYALKRLQTKKHKIVDRRASKSRKIRYHVQEKIVNFMAPEPANVPPMASKLFENLFGLKTPKPALVS